MKSKSLILMVLSLGFGLVAAIGISQVMKNNSANASAVQQMGAVIVAAEHLDVKTELTEENVRIENWPVNIIPPDAVRSLEEIADKAVKTPMPKGMPITMPQIALKSEMGVTGIPPGFKLFGIKVTGESTVSGLLSPGDKVDVIGLFKRRNKAGREQTISKTFRKAIKVFAINGNMSAVMDPEEKKSSGSAIVSVLVTEKQAEEIAFVQKVGSLKLIMRGEQSEDDEQVESLADIMRLEDDEDLDEDAPEYQAPAIANKPKDNGPTTMIVWKGGNAVKMVFSPDGLPQQIGLAPGEAQMMQPPGRMPVDPAMEDMDEGDFDGRMENDRRTGEDQYRSE